MREIKFRGWHTVKKIMFSAEKMAKDQLTLLPTGEFINVHGTSTKLSTIFPKDKFIPLQFTGLKDKNGKEIYEGDIINAYDSPNYNNLIVKFGEHETDRGDYYSSFAYGFYLENSKSQTSMNMSKYTNYKIIGNIYENPELLTDKGGKNESKS